MTGTPIEVLVPRKVISKLDIRGITKFIVYPVLGGGIQGICKKIRIVFLRDPDPNSEIPILIPLAHSEY